MNIFLQILFSYLATIGFGIIVNIPRKALNACGIIGVLGWLTYLGINNGLQSSIMANLVAAFIIGGLSIICARYKKMPTILFNIPSLVPLVPGGQAYRAARYFVFGNVELGINYAVQAALIAGSIAMGFFLAELVGQVYFKITSV